MPQELLSFWQGLSPEMRGYILDGGVALGALLIGHWLGLFVGRFLRNWGFNSIFRVTAQAQDQYQQDDRRFTPTMLAGMLVRLTVWAAGAWWLLREHGRPEIAETITKTGGRIWAVTAALTAALALASLLARRVIECLEGVAPPTANRTGPAPRSLAGPVGAGIYALVLLLTLLTVADYFAWPQTRTAVAGLWQLALQLLTAGAAVLVGYLGARWAKEFATPQNANSELQPAQQTALGIVVLTTALAVALLLFGGGLGVGVAILVGAAGLLYFARGRLPDVIAGLKLRKDKIETVWFEGTPWQVARIGLVNSQVSRSGASYKVANRQVLQASGFVENAPQSNGRPALMR